MARFFRLVPAAAGVWLALAAQPAGAAAQVKNPGTLVVGHTGEVTSLDPVYPYDAASQSLIYNVYETLIAYEGSSLERFVPALAREVPSLKNGLISKDGKTYSFPIRSGVRFHDGGALTPEDVRYSLLRFMLSDSAGGPSSLLLEPILGVPSTRGPDSKLQVEFQQAAAAVRVEGDRVVIKLKRPFGPFLPVMARWSYVMSKTWAKAHGEWDGSEESWKKFNDPRKGDSYFFDHMNGTGPFALERWDRQARKVYLKRNGDYWRAPAKLERVLVMSANEFGTSRLMLQAGDADIIDVSRSLLQQVEGIPGVRVVDNLPRLQTDPVLFFTLRINPEANPDIGSGKLDGDGVPPDFFQDASLRKAFAYAFDDRAFIEQAFRGRAVRAKGPIPPGIPGYDAGQAAYGHDLKKAALFFKKAHGGRVWERGFRFTLTYNVGSELREVACQILKRNVESLNPKFRIDLRGVEWASFLDKTQARKMPMWSRGWVADYPDAHNFAFPFFHSQGRYAIAQGYNNPEMDRLIEKAVVEVRPGPRAALYRRIQTLGFEEAVQIYTIHPAGSSVQRTWVRGFTDNPIFMGIYFYPIYKEL